MNVYPAQTSDEQSTYFIYTDDTSQEPLENIPGQYIQFIGDGQGISLGCQSAAPGFVTDVSDLVNRSRSMSMNLYNDDNGGYFFGHCAAN